MFKIYQCMVNLFHGVAVYTGVVMVCKLAGLVGLLLYVLTGMAVLAPIVFSITVLLLDLNLGPDVRFGLVAKIGISSFKTLILVVVPLGLLLCWGFSQCLVTRIKRSRRELSSNLIAFVLVIFHLVGLAEYVVYILVNTTENLENKVFGTLFE